MCVTGGVAAKPSTAASSWTTSPIVGVGPPTVAVMTVAHVVVAHTHRPPAVLGATVVHEDSEASYWLLANIQQPITSPRQLKRRGCWRYVLRAFRRSCGDSQSGGSRGQKEKVHTVRNGSEGREELVFQ